MSPKLDNRLSKTGNVLWQTIVKDGEKWNLQVRIMTEELERIVAQSILANGNTHSSVAGPLLLQLTRQS